MVPAQKTRHRTNLFSSVNELETLTDPRSFFEAGYPGTPVFLVRSCSGAEVVPRGSFFIQLTKL